jgi:3-dehydroquinate dehydratase type I
MRPAIAEGAQSEQPAGFLAIAFERPMKIFVTTFDLDPAAVAALAARDCDGIELRAETTGTLDLHALRAATTKPLLLTYRGQRIATELIAAAIEAGIDLVDVEWHDDVDVSAFRDRIVLSHHDYERVPDDLESLVDAMLARGCAETKLAVTPHHFADNERLMAALRARPGLTLFGMGERGLYSRILAPFLGSRLVFVAPDDEHIAAPGQIALDRALAIYGDRRVVESPRIFAIAGNPAGHSLSPSIHNARFRERGLPAVYTIASVERFDELTPALLRGDIAGLSVTAPFKEDAYRFARAQGADVRAHASACEAVNTLVRFDDGRLIADNTDVDGFLALLPEGVGRAAVVGAGGTARAAIVALRERGIAFDVFNRTPRTILGVTTRPLDAIEGDFLIDTLPGDVDLGQAGAPVPHGISAAYQRGGLQLLYEQAKRQNALFAEVFG